MTTLHGTVEPGFAKVADAFATCFSDYGDVGAAVAVFRDGHPVVDLWAGAADATGTRPWARDTVVMTFSTTKGVTAMCANLLMQRGRLDPNAPVARYWPEFAANGKHDITVRFASLPGLKQTWRDLPVPDAGEATYYFRVQTNNTGPFFWPPPALAGANEPQMNADAHR